MSQHPPCDIVSFTDPGRLAIYCHHSPPTVYAEETHDTVQVCIPFEGAQYEVTRWSELGRRHVHRLGPRDVLVVPLAQPHASAWQRPAHVLSLHMSSRFFEEAIGRPSLMIRDTLTLRDPLVTLLAGELRAALAGDDAPQPALVGAFATLIAHRLGLEDAGARASSRVPAFSTEQMARIDRYIDGHLDEPIPLLALSAEVRLSTWHFLRRFRTTTGMPPHAFITQRRLRHAQRLLAETDQAIVDVALDVGMSHSHFSCLFLRTFGVSPRSFRARHKR
jgi:AraC-like DNA-binding protein